jgi:hypothetical protein
MSGINGRQHNGMSTRPRPPHQMGYGYQFVWKSCPGDLRIGDTFVQLGRGDECGLIRLLA